jgi:hypothetical protein
MTLSNPKYVVGQMVQVYDQVYIITAEGVLDGGEFWYHSREYDYDYHENLITWGRTFNLPEEDMVPLGNIIPANARQFYPGRNPKNGI